MKKMISKEGLAYQDGYIVDSDGNIIAIDPEVVDLANALETISQKSHWCDHSEPTVVKEFKKVSEHEVKINYFKCDTPLMDARAAETVAYLDELDRVNNTDSMNEALDQFAELIAFVHAEKFLVDDANKVERFDLATLGNPLEWTEDTIANVIAFAHGAKIVDNEIVSKNEDVKPE